MSLSLSACSTLTGETKSQSTVGSDILKTFGKEDKERMQKFINRFDDHKVDYVLAIPPFIDGGYVIYDLIAGNGKIKVRMDTTRDTYSNDAGLELTCKAIKFDNNGTVVVEQCTGPEGVEVSHYSLFSFDPTRK